MCYSCSPECDNCYPKALKCEKCGEINFLTLDCCSKCGASLSEEAKNQARDAWNNGERLLSKATLPPFILAMKSKGVRPQKQ